MSVTLCQYTIGGLCCITASACANTPIVCGTTCIATPCVAATYVCGSTCVIAPTICAAAGNLTTNCCVVAPIHCATTCFVGNGSGLTNLPASGAFNCICSVSVSSCINSIYFCNVFSSTYSKYMMVYRNFCGVCNTYVPINFLLGSSNIADTGSNYHYSYSFNCVCLNCIQGNYQDNTSSLPFIVGPSNGSQIFPTAFGTTYFYHCYNNPYGSTNACGFAMVNQAFGSSETYSVFGTYYCSGCSCCVTGFYLSGSYGLLCGNFTLYGLAG